MQKFLGAFERQLDIKGRLALPSTYRARLGTSCYLTLGADNSIEVFTAEKFEEEAERMDQRQKNGEISMDQLRAFSARANPVEPDGQGRVYLDERLRKHARLTTKGPVMVLGRLDRLEICSVDRFDRSMANGEQSYSEPARTETAATETAATETAATETPTTATATTGAHGPDHHDSTT